MKICLIAILFITMTLSILYLTDTVFADNILAEDTNEAADSFSASESTVQLKSFSYKKVAATAAKNICAHTGISLSASEAYIPAPSFMAVSVASGESDAEDGMSDSEAHRIMLSFGSALPISCEIA